MSAGIIIYYYFFHSKLNPQSRKPDAGEQNASLTPSLSLSTTIPEPFSKAATGEEKLITVENDVFKILLCTKGGAIKKVTLKKYKDKKGQELVLLDDQSGYMGLVFPLTYNNTWIDVKDLYFQTQEASMHFLNGSDRTTIVFRLEIAPDKYLEQYFEFSGSSYQITHGWRAVGMEEYISKEKPTFFNWAMAMKRFEIDYVADRDKSTINYYLANHSFKGLKSGSTKVEQKKIDASLKWVSIKQRFFSSAIIATDSFSTGDVALEPAPVGRQDITKLTRISLELTPKEREEGQGKFTFFFGPNDYTIMRQVTKGFEENIPLGWPVVKWVNQGLIIPIFSFLEKHFNNYGLIIFLLVITIKLLLAPLSYKSFISMAKMKAVKPELDKIKEKYGNNQQKAQAEQIAFYRELGINPLSGCIPLLLQMPILMAMFHFFPNAIALRQAPFLWARDLSTYDSIVTLPFTLPIYGNHISLFTILMGISIILYAQSSNQSNATEGPLKGLSYIMPITFIAVLNSYPAGLSFYYCISNVITYLQQKLTKFFVNERDIKEKLLSRPKKVHSNERPSFQSRVIASIQDSNKKKK